MRWVLYHVDRVLEVLSTTACDCWCCRLISLHYGSYCWHYFSRSCNIPTCDLYSSLIRIAATMSPVSQSGCFLLFFSALEWCMFVTRTRTPTRTHAHTHTHTHQQRVSSMYPVQHQRQYICQYLTRACAVDHIRNCLSQSLYMTGMKSLTSCKFFEELCFHNIIAGW